MIVSGGNKKRFLIIVVQVLIAALHLFGVGRHAGEKLFNLSASYFSDLALPFSFYFLLFLLEEKIAFLKNKYIKAAIIFCAATIAEILQYFGVYALGRTFDPLDIAVYAMGLFMAISLDRLFAKIFTFWDNE